MCIVVSGKKFLNFARISHTGGKLTDNQLRISLSDLMRVEETGRWWLVGSAWAGGLTAERQTDTVTGTCNASDKILALSLATARDKVSSLTKMALLHRSRY